MKKTAALLMFFAVMVCAFTACSGQNSGSAELEITGITLSDGGVLIGGDPAPTKPNAPVYVANDIVFYSEGQGKDYGEGSARDEHSQREADRHTVVHITEPGNYNITGALSCGQIAVDLGDNAKNDPDAVVNITLNNVELTSTVAPAIICYSAYECSSDDREAAVKDVDTSAAGFNIILADGTENSINGGHVAKIYKPGTEKKLHKYDAAIESLVSFNIVGSDGILNVTADREGIESKLHMTINGGTVNINSMDDALNAGEDYVSVITVNGGRIYANSNNGLEGDGIDSNGWIVINGGCVSAFSSEKSMDSGLDSDNGIYLNGGTVYATGTMYDSVSAESNATVAVLSFGEWMFGEDFLVLRNADGKAVAGFKSTADHKAVILSSADIPAGEYTLCKASSVTGSCIDGIYTDITATENEIQLGHRDRSSDFGPMPIKGGKGKTPEFDRPQGEIPPEFDSEMPPPDFSDMPVGFRDEGRFDYTDGLTDVFIIKNGFNMFSGIQALATE